MSNAQKGEPIIQPLKRILHLPMSEEEAWAYLEARERQVGTLTTLTAGGWPMTVPIIFVAHERKIYFNSFKWNGDILLEKVRNIANNPIVNVLVHTGRGDIPPTPNRYVSVVGTAKVVADPAVGDYSKIEGFWHKYQEKYGSRPRRLSEIEIGVPKDMEHIYYEVTPIRIASVDFAKT